MAGLLVGAGGPAGRDRRRARPPPSFRSGSPAGSPTHAAATRSTRAPTSCSPGSSAPSIPTGTVTPTTPARVALVPLVEPFAAFTDGPLARAVDGALRLDTLVVAAAGNDGPAGPAFGSVGGPAGAPAALAVGAADAGRNLTQVRVVVRAGLRVLFDRSFRSSAAPPPAQTLVAGAVRPPGPPSSRHGLSQVADRAAVAAAGVDPAVTARPRPTPARPPCVLHGRPSRPARSLSTDGSASRWSCFREEVTRRCAPSRERLVVIAAPRASGDARTAAAPFSSWGLAFDGGIKPDLLAPGVGLATADPGAAPTAVRSSARSAARAPRRRSSPARRRCSRRRGPTRAPRGCARCSSAAPDRSTGHRRPPRAPGCSTSAARPPRSSSPIRRSSRSAAGRSRAGAGNEVLASATSPAGGSPSTSPPGGRRIRPLRLGIKPRRTEIEPGAVARIARPHSADHDRPGRGGARVAHGHARDGSGDPGPVGRRPPARPCPPRPADPLAWVVQAVRAAAVRRRHARRPRAAHGRRQHGRPGAQARRRALDRQGQAPRPARPACATCCPGRYAIGLTGHAPGGKVLAPGAYRLRVFAWPTAGGRPTVRSVPFRITK